MAYKRTAQLPGTQAYGLTRRPTRKVEEFIYNPGTPRRTRQTLVAAPVAGTVPGGSSFAEFPGLEAETADPVSDVSAEGEVESGNLSETQEAAMAHALGQLGPEIGIEGIKDALMGLIGGRTTSAAIKGGVKGLLPQNPISLALNVFKLNKAYGAALASLEASGKARETNPMIGQAEIGREGRGKVGDPLSGTEMSQSDVAMEAPPPTGVLPGSLPS